LIFCFEKFFEQLQIALESCHAIGNFDYRLVPILDLIADEHSPLDDGDDIANAMPKDVLDVPCSDYG
jgi:hypothetical protein